MTRPSKLRQKRRESLFNARLARGKPKNTEQHAAATHTTPPPPAPHTPPPPPHAAPPSTSTSGAAQKLTSAQKRKKLSPRIKECKKSVSENILIRKEDIVKFCEGVACSWCYESQLQCKFIQHQVDVHMTVTCAHCHRQVINTAPDPVVSEKNIDGSSPSCSRTRAEPLPIESASSETTSSPLSPALSTALSEDELLLDEDVDLKLEIKEEVVDDTPTEFVNVLDHVEELPASKEEHDVDTLAVSKPSISASSSNVQFLDLNPHQMETPPVQKENPVDILAVTKPSIISSTCSALPSKVEDGDEFHFFGMFVASQLRALPLRDALQAQLEIQTIIAQKRSQRLT